MSDVPEPADTRTLDAQRAALPRGWALLDRAILAATYVAIVVVGSLFVLMVTLEVVSRYVFDLSLSFVNGGSRLLLIWFFLLGAGPAIRQGAHVGFDLLVQSLAPRRRRLLVLVGFAFVFTFFAQMIWSGLHLVGPGLRQSWAGMDISFFWVAIAVPIGFGLAIYHLAVLAFVVLREANPAGDGKP